MHRPPGSTEADLFCRAERQILYMVNIQNVFYQIAFCKNKNIQKSLANFRLANFRFLPELSSGYPKGVQNSRSSSNSSIARVTPYLSKAKTAYHKNVVLLLQIRSS